MEVHIDDYDVDDDDDDKIFIQLFFLNKSFFQQTFLSNQHFFSTKNFAHKNLIFIFFTNETYKVRSANSWHKNYKLWCVCVNANFYVCMPC